MKHVVSALFLVIFGLAISASAGRFQMSQAEIKALEKSLVTAKLQRQVITDNDFDDNDGPGQRGWNPITWITNQFRNKCVCENNKCNCCFKLKLFQSKACLSAEKLPTEQKLSISFKLDETSLVEKKFELSRTNSVCGNVPVPALAFMKFCFTQQLGLEKNGAISSCSMIEFKVGTVTGAVLQFQCLELKGGKITFGGHKELQKAAMFTLQVKHPFKAAVELYRQATNRRDLLE